MHRRHFLAGAAAVPLAGCATFSSSDDEQSRLHLTVQNDRDTPVSVAVSVVGDDGTTYESTSDQVDSGVARAFEVTVGSSGRHEATVSGDDWRGQVAWQADTCSQFDATVRVTPDAVEVASECVQQQ